MNTRFEVLLPLMPRKVWLNVFPLQRKLEGGKDCSSPDPSILHGGATVLRMFQSLKLSSESPIWRGGGCHSRMPPECPAPYTTLFHSLTAFRENDFPSCTTEPTAALSHRETRPRSSRAGISAHMSHIPGTVPGSASWIRSL